MSGLVRAGVTWNSKGYNDFGFSSQNLCDQAARLDRSLGQLEQCIRVEQGQFNTGYTNGRKFKRSLYVVNRYSLN